MQKVLNLRLISQAALPLLALTGISATLVPSQLDSSIVEAAMFTAGMIGVAAVMRSNITDLVKWRKEHVEREDEWKERHESTHEKIVEMLAELKAARKEADRRLGDLERIAGGRRRDDR